jgi:hypothetical protein
MGAGEESLMNATPIRWSEIEKHANRAGKVTRRKAEQRIALAVTRMHSLLGSDPDDPRVTLAESVLQGPSDPVYGLRAYVAAFKDQGLAAIAAAAGSVPTTDDRTVTVEYSDGSVGSVSVSEARRLVTEEGYQPEADGGVLRRIREPRGLASPSDEADDGRVPNADQQVPVYARRVIGRQDRVVSNIVVGEGLQNPRLRMRRDSPNGPVTGFDQV